MASAQAGVVDVRISQSYDDAEERSNGQVSRSSADLDLVEEKGDLRTVGLRFPGLVIPQGATIGAAWVQFTAD
jgi:hypothetical protein